MEAFQEYRYPLARRARKTSAGATNEEIELGPVPPGRLWVINQLALEDETTKFTSFRVYIKGMGYNHYVLGDTALAAATLYWTDTPISLGETRSLVVRFVGTTNNDALAVYLSGFEVIQPGPGAPPANA